MSYAIRNTIILSVTLLLFAGSAFVYIHFFQKSTLEDLETKYAKLQTDYNSKKATSDAYPEMNRQYQEALAVINNYNKALFKSNAPDVVFDYLNYLSNSDENSQIFFDFTFNDSTSHDQYGIIRSSIQGYASYSNFINFLNKLENSRLLNKVRDLTLSPPGGAENINDITFSFTLESYFEKTRIQESTDNGMQLAMNRDLSSHNPFYPLILESLPPNTRNLINIEQSRIIGLTGSRVFLIDQNGNVHSLRRGDEVYLGRLQSIDLKARTVTFNLNKGGITEMVTLEIEK